MSVSDSSRPPSPTRRELLLVRVGVPLGLAAIFLCVDRVLHQTLDEQWHQATHWLMAALLLAVSFIFVTAHQRSLARRGKARELLSAQEESYRTLFDLFPEPYTIWSGDGRLLMANQIARRRFPPSAERQIGRSVVEVFGPQAAATYLTPLRRVFETGVTEEREERVNVPGIGLRVYWSALQRVNTPAYGPAVQVVSYDITERVLAEEALRASELLRVQERSALDERQRLARELHDSVSQALYGIALGVNTALAVMDRDREAAREALTYAIGLARAGLSEMRALIFELRPESLESEGLVAGLTKQTDAVRARFELPVTFAACDEPVLPLATKEALYRIAQEALHNAVKHAQARSVRVELTCEPRFLTLRICDDGVGFEVMEKYPGHLGLKSMHERVDSVGGTLRITSAPGEGTVIEARAPLDAQ